MLPKKLDEEVAAAHLDHLGVRLTNCQETRLIILESPKKDLSSLTITDTRSNTFLPLPQTPLLKQEQEYSNIFITPLFLCLIFHCKLKLILSSFYYQCSLLHMLMFKK